MEEGGTPNDASILRPAIQIGSRGIAQILKVYQAGTEEIRKLLTQECEVIFECKVCRSLFRGLPNLISHKRAYCMNEYVEQRKDFPNFYSSDVITVFPEVPNGKGESELGRLLIEPTVTPNRKPTKSIPKTNLVPLLSPTGKSTWLKPQNRDVTQNSENDKASGGDEEFAGANEGNENQSSVMQIVPAQDREMLTCSQCNKRFTTTKSLMKHYSHMHLDEQTLYKCPTCPSVFTYQRSCRRHLERKHRKTSAEISKIMKVVIHKATKVSRKSESNNSSPSKDAKVFAKTSNKVASSSSGQLEVAGTEAKSNSNPVESAALTSKAVQNSSMQSKESDDDFSDMKERLTCPDCGKEFEKRSILDRHMKVCADYAKIAVTFDMSLMKGMQHLATNYSGNASDKSDNGDGKRSRRKAAPNRLADNVTDSDMESDVQSVMSDKSSRFDGLDSMPKLQPEAPLKVETVCRPSGKGLSKTDECLAKQTKLSSIETVLQFLKNPKKRTMMNIVGNETTTGSNSERDLLPPKLEREDLQEYNPSSSQATAEQKNESEVLSLENSVNDGANSNDESSVHIIVKEESQLSQHVDTEVPADRKRALSESRATRIASLKSWDYSLDEKRRSDITADRSCTSVLPLESSKPVLKSKATEFEVIDLESKHRPERQARKRELSEERIVTSAKRREILMADQTEPGKFNRRAPRYASNFTTRRRQSMLENILAGVDGEENDQAEEDVDSDSQSLGEKLEIATTSSSSSGGKTPTCSYTAKVVKLKEGEKNVSKRDEKPADKAGGDRNGDTEGSEADCDEARVLRCMLSDVDTAPKGRRKGALLPSHIAQHVNQEEKLCNICKTNFDSVIELISHISKTHMNMKRYRCALCSVEGMYFSEITRHIARTHRRAFRANHKLEWLSQCVKPINISSE